MDAFGGGNDEESAELRKLNAEVVRLSCFKVCLVLNSCLARRPRQFRDMGKAGPYSWVTRRRDQSQLEFPSYHFYKRHLRSVPSQVSSLLRILEKICRPGIFNSRDRGCRVGTKFNCQSTRRGWFVQVYERGVASITNSVDLWTNYCSFKVETSHDSDIIRE